MNDITTPTVDLPVIEIKGQRLVTLAMVDKVHQRPDGTAKRNFHDHRSRFIEAEDYFVVTGDEIRTQSLGHAFAPRTSKGILLTESGYLMLVKSFTDDLAWEVQRKLIKHYFRVKDPAHDLQGTIADLAKLRTVLVDYTEQVVALEAKVREQKAALQKPLPALPTPAAAPESKRPKPAPAVRRPVDRNGAAAYLAELGYVVSPRTLAKKASIGGGPRFQKFGRRVSYHPDDLDEWLNSITTPRGHTCTEISEKIRRGNVE